MVKSLKESHIINNYDDKFIFKPHIDALKNKKEAAFFIQKQNLVPYVERQLWKQSFSQC